MAHRDDANVTPTRHHDEADDDEADAAGDDPVLSALVRHPSFHVRQRAWARATVCDSCGGVSGGYYDASNDVFHLTCANVDRAKRRLCRWHVCF